MPRTSVSQSGPVADGKLIGAVCFDSSVGDARDVMAEERPCDGAIQVFQEGEERRNSIVTTGARLR